MKWDVFALGVLSIRPVPPPPPGLSLLHRARSQKRNTFKIET